MRPFLWFWMVGLLACNLSPNDPPQRSKVMEEDEMIFIVDATGKKWDVTHAVRRYGFDPNKFQYGLGPFAIRPIIDPNMLSPGDPGYPEDREAFLVIGTRVEGEARAYPLDVMITHEIVDDQFGETYVAVAY